MGDKTVIKVSGVSKTFKLPHESGNSIKSKIINFKKRGFETQVALSDISFEVKKGEFFGIVGRNGSGKSTLLKMLAGIYQPSAGNIEIEGKLTPFIELGVGFNPELSGRDNVFLNGALLGFTRNQMAEMYEDIVKFAEIERFMDQKLKNYSSGMQVRLAFSIAIRASTDILILDEVLAVGDVNFQKKCFDYFNQLKKEKKTIVLVTHDMSAVERFCDRAILINDGKLVATGKPDMITQAYSDLNFQSESDTLNNVSKPSSEHHTVQATVMGDKTKKQSSVRVDDKKVVIDLDINVINTIEETKLGLIIYNSAKSPIFATNSGVTNQNFSISKQKNVRFEIDNIFSNGTYTVALTLKSPDGSVIYYTNDAISQFVVGGRKHEYAVVSPDYTLKS